MLSLDATVDFFEGLMPGSQPQGYWSSFEALLAILRKGRIRGAFAGALALNAHGISRATEDIDYLVRPEHQSRLVEALGARFDLVENHDALLVFRDPRTSVEIDLLVPFDAISLEACGDPMVASVRGHRVKVIRAEALAAMKTVAAVDSPSQRSKQQADLELLVRRQKVDVNRVARWLLDEAGAEYARFFLAAAKRSRTTPERVPPKRRL